MTNVSTIGRRTAMGLGLATGAAAVAPRRARAQAKEVSIAMLVPLSGPWARQGILEQMGARMAIDDVNNAGGIKALGGAKLKLLEYDTQDSAEKAKDSAQRMLAQNPDVVGGFGCWLSTFTLAVTEVTERAELPWLTLSYSDAITGRGFKYVFQSSPTADAQAEDLVPMIIDLATKASGKRPTKVGIVGDNTAAAVSFYKPLHDHVFKNEKLNLVVDEVYTPPLADATTLVQGVRSARPDFMLIQSTNVPDDKLLIDKFAEYNLTASKLPMVGGGGHWCVPELLKVAGADNLEGVLVGLANWPGKAVADVAQRFVERTKEPWFGHDSDLRLCARADPEGGVGARRHGRQAQGGGGDPSAQHDRRVPRCSSPTVTCNTTRRAAASVPSCASCNGRRAGPTPVYPATIAASDALWPKVS